MLPLLRYAARWLVAVRQMLASICLEHSRQHMSELRNNLYDEINLRLADRLQRHWPLSCTLFRSMAQPTIPSLQWIAILWTCKIPSVLPPRNAVGLWQIWPRIKSVARAPSFVRVLKHQLHSLDLGKQQGGNWWHHDDSQCWVLLTSGVRISSMRGWVVSLWWHPLSMCSCSLWYHCWWQP